MEKISEEEYRQKLQILSKIMEEENNLKEQSRKTEQLLFRVAEMRERLMKDIASFGEIENLK